MRPALRNIGAHPWGVAQRMVSRWLFVGVLVLTAIVLPCGGQTTGSQAEDNSSLSRARDGRGYTLRVTTREVVIEVVARDRNNRPIDDLKADELQLFEGSHKDPALIRRLSGFRVVDPDSDEGERKTQEGLTILPVGGRCEIRSAVHYELAFHPQRWSGGIHIVRVVVNRKHVSLSYRSQFYVGITDVSQHPALEMLAGTDTELLRSACYHPGTPPSIPLSVAGNENAGAGTARYVLTIAPDSLALAGIDEGTDRVQLAYGICTFSRSGRILGSWHSSVDKPVEARNLAEIMNTGWTEEINVPRHGTPALIRLVVREPRTGNLGLVDVAGTRPAIAKSSHLSESTPRHRLILPEDAAAGISEHVGGHLSLGSPVPAPNSLCGDVYELPQTTLFLPDDFKSLNAVGAVYTNSLSVPERILPQGLPGSTPRSDWFGIDYYGEFWVTKPGKYEFVLSADDGADLYIDERRIVNDDGIHPPQTVSGTVKLDAGRHTIHLPYFQGPTYVSLVLQVKPPDGILDVFDLRNYARPSPASSH